MSGVSGFEGDVLQKIEELIQNSVEYTEYDAGGSLYAFKKGKKGSCGKTVLYSCHADEVGFMIKHIEDDGTLLFDSIGIGTEAYLGKKVLIGKDKIPGIISVKPYHLLDSKEKDAPVASDGLSIYIGAKNKEEAEKLGVYADFAVFDSRYEEFGSSKVKAKALDDRIGCAMLVSLILGGVEYDSYFAFCTCEEGGLRGSKTVAANINPDIVINLECTTAADICGALDSKKVCALSGGVVVPFMDRLSVYTPALHEKIMTLAKQKKIPHQTKTEIAGGTDAGSYTTACGGRKTVGLAVPTRYLHSAVSVASKDDIESCEKLLFAISENIKDLAE